MNFIADTHTHTNACSHAYSTLLENVAAAKNAGLKFLCNTQHGPAIPDAPHFWCIKNQKVFPQMIDGVMVLKGVEANIVDYDGTLDLEDSLLEKLDWVIASYHKDCIAPQSFETHTAGWLSVAKNPNVDVIGHCGDSRFDFDHEKVIKAFKEYEKIVEVNDHSFVCRPGSPKNCVEIIRLCKKYGVPVVASSDAHFAGNIGVFDNSMAALKEADFPEELVLNADYDRFLAAARKTSGKALV